MESAREFTSPQVGASLPYSVARHDAAAKRPDVVALQVDSTVSGIDGLAWLGSRRDDDTVRKLDALNRTASEAGWSWADLARTRLKLLKPRRAEIHELGAAYLAALTPGAAEAVSALRRAGVAVVLSSEVAAESLFGIATALGIGPDELYAPHLRFDAIGAYVGCDLASVRVDGAGEAAGASAPPALGSPSHTLYVGTHRSVNFAPRGSDPFIAFSGVVAREGRTDAAASLGSFHDLAALVLR